MKIMVAFVPVLHDGYLRLFKNSGAEYLYLMDSDLYGQIECLTREIRLVAPSEMCLAIDALGIFRKVTVINQTTLQLLASEDEIIMPDEDICQVIAEEYLTGRNITFQSARLRFDLSRTLTKEVVLPDRQISSGEFDRELINFAQSEANLSPDWWRQVGAVLVKDGEILSTAYNHHVPNDYSLYEQGDPRNNFSPGQLVDVSRAQHAERVLISTAAADGLSTRGASLYVTTFPCPSCTADVITAKIAKVFFRDGYSQLEGRELFEAAGIEVIQVK